MDASDIYERYQPGYIPSHGDWKCDLCQNNNFKRRRWCYNPNCGAPKGWIAKNAEKNVVVPKEKDDHNEVENAPDVSPEPDVSGKDKNDHEDAAERDKQGLA